MAAVHEFRSSLEIERQGRALLDAGYRQIFGGLVEDRHLMRSRAHQLGGVDVLLFLRTGRTLAVDEKVRSYGVPSADVALEIEHVYPDGSTRPGWLVKPSSTDFIAFAWLEDSVVWLLPLQGLLSAYERRWKDDRGLKRIEARNRTHVGERYITRSVVVPADRVTAAVGAALRVRVKELS